MYSEPSVMFKKLVLDGVNFVSHRLSVYIFCIICVYVFYIENFSLYLCVGIFVVARWQT